MCGCGLAKYEMREEKEEKKNFSEAPADVY